MSGVRGIRYGVGLLALHCQARKGGDRLERDGGQVTGGVSQGRLYQCAREGDSVGRSDSSQEYT